MTCVQSSTGGYNRNSTHDAIRDVVMSSLHSCGIPSSIETANLLPTYMNTRGERKALLLDGVVAGMQDSRVGFDVSLVHSVPLSASEPGAPHRSKPTTLAYIEEREAKKLAKYGEACKSEGIKFRALCLSTYGELGEEFLDFIDDITSYAATVHSFSATSANTRKQQLRRAIYQ